MVALCFGRRRYRSRRELGSGHCGINNVNKPSFFAELQRRHVYKVGAMYTVGGWLLVQVVTQVLPVFDVPALGQRLLVLTVIAGFPVALVIAWIFDLTPQGLVRTPAIEIAETPVASRQRRSMDRRLNYILGGLLVLALGYVVIDRFLLRTSDGTAKQVVAAAIDKSIAVLPFENLSRDPDNAFFADGMQDEILTKLSKIGSLKVISRTSTAHYASSPANLPEIAAQLGVAAILEGSVQRAGDRVHINVQLIRAATDDHLWAESYDRKLDDVFAMQGEVAESVAEVLSAKLSGRERQQLNARPTHNTEAYDAYLRGLAFAQRNDALAANSLRSIKAFETAVQLDPNFALAWAWLSRERSFYYRIEEPTAAWHQLALDALEKAKALQPDLPETLIAEGYYHYSVDAELGGAKTLFEQLRTQLPGNSDIVEALAFIACREGHWDDSVKMFQQAIEIDPQNVALLFDAILTELSMRRLPAAQKLLQRALDLKPNDPGLLLWQVDVLQQAGYIDAAQKILDSLTITPGDVNGMIFFTDNALYSQHYDAAVQLLKSQLEHPEAIGTTLCLYQLELGELEFYAGDTINSHRHILQAKATAQAALAKEPKDTFYQSVLAEADAQLGEKTEALALAKHVLALESLSKNASASTMSESHLASIQVHFGDLDEAFPILEHLISIPNFMKPLGPTELRLDPGWAPLRKDPRFPKLLADSETVMREQAQAQQ